MNEAGEGAGDIIGVSGTGAKAGTRGSLRLLSDLTSLISAFGNFGKIFNQQDYMFEYQKIRTFLSGLLTSL